MKMENKNFFYTSIYIVFEYSIVAAFFHPECKNNGLNLTSENILIGRDDQDSW